VADTEIEGVLRDLLLRKDLSADTRAELAEFEAEAKGGRLDSADRKYVLALAKRLTGKAAGAATGDGDTLDYYEEETPWRDRAHAAEAKLEAMRAAVDRVLDPAALGADDPEAEIRRRLRDALRSELERIEKGEA
jgi:hypothetical protein